MHECPYMKASFHAKIYQTLGYKLALEFFVLNRFVIGTINFKFKCSIFRFPICIHFVQKQFDVIPDTLTSILYLLLKAIIGYIESEYPVKHDAISTKYVACFS